MNKYVVSNEVNKLNVIGDQIESIYEMDINLNNSISCSLITGKITQFKNAMLTECANPVLFVIYLKSIQWIILKNLSFQSYFVFYEKLKSMFKNIKAKRSYSCNNIPCNIGLKHIFLLYIKDYTFLFRFIEIY
jgi:hypothetical protein